MSFFSFDLDPMPLILKRDLDMGKMYLYTENKIPICSSSKIIALTDRHRNIDTQTDITYPHTLVVNLAHSSFPFEHFCH